MVTKIQAVAEKYAQFFLDGHRHIVIRWLSTHSLTRSTADTVAITALMMTLLPKYQQLKFSRLSESHANEVELYRIDKENEKRKKSMENKQGGG